MAKIKYKDWNFRNDSLERIAQINAILDDYVEQEYTVTLRQLYYQLVSKNIIANSKNEYTNLSNLLKNGRNAGLVDWDCIIDITRNVRTLSHWDSPSKIIEAAAEQYHRDLWETQPYYLENWVEKDALLGVVEKASHRYDVSCFSCHGYGSATAYRERAECIIDKNEDGKKCIILHLGDCDPSGEDMTRDIQEKMTLYRANVQVRRIALTRVQIEQYKLPPQPAKKTDSRFKEYEQKHGASSWELDALEPRVLDKLITDSILEYLDIDLFEQVKFRQEQERKQLIALAG